MVDILGTPTGYEKKIPPEYNLQSQQDRKVLIWIECPRSSGAGFDLQEKLTSAFQFYLIEKAGFRPDNIISERPNSQDEFTQEPAKVAQSLGAGYVLLIQVDDFETVPLNVRDYYSGQMQSQAVLMDADLGIAVWPQRTGTKIVEVGVDLETTGRAVTISRLVSATTHCTLRYLYPCEKMKFKTADEKISIQDAYEMETY